MLDFTTIDTIVVKWGVAALSGGPGNQPARRSAVRGRVQRIKPGAGGVGGTSSPIPR